MCTRHVSSVRHGRESQSIHLATSMAHGQCARRPEPCGQLIHFIVFHANVEGENVMKIRHKKILASKGGAALTDEDFLRIAMQSAQEAIEDGDMPFGACVINEKRFVLSVAHNRVNTSMDPTAHAEVQAIREAGRKLRSADLRSCVLYTTCEPCAMCFSACVWS